VTLLIVRSRERFPRMFVTKRPGHDNPSPSALQGAERATHLAVLHQQQLILSTVSLIAPKDLSAKALLVQQ
jgi:hypothetical protein